MSALAIVLIVLGVLLVLFFIGGLLAVRARARQQAPTFDEHVRAADEALEQARALDRGWHRETMEAAARAAIADGAARAGPTRTCTSCSSTTAPASRRTAPTSSRSARTAKRA